MIVSCAANAEEAMDIARDAPYDVVLLDIWLPGRDGLEVLTEMREGFDAGTIFALEPRDHRRIPRHRDRRRRLSRSGRRSRFRGGWSARCCSGGSRLCRCGSLVGRGFRLRLN